MWAKNFQFDGEFIDGQIVRFKAPNDRDGKKSAWVIYFADRPHNGSFGSWKTGEKYKWSAVAVDNLPAAEQRAYRKRLAIAKQKRREARKAAQTKAATKAKKMMSLAGPVGRHPYLEAKDIPGDGLSLYKGLLLVPMCDADGILHNVQRIYPDGAKKGLYGGRMAGMRHIIQGTEQICLCEGYATGATLHQATGNTVVIAFTANNLLTVGRSLPGQQVIVCADNDQFTDDNPGLTKGREVAEAIGGRLAYPKFKNLEGNPTDFNDLAAMEGLDAVIKQVRRGVRH